MKNPKINKKQLILDLVEGLTIYNQELADSKERIIISNYLINLIKKDMNKQ